MPIFFGAALTVSTDFLRRRAHGVDGFFMATRSRCRRIFYGDALTVSTDFLWRHVHGVDGFFMATRSRCRRIFYGNTFTVSTDFLPKNFFRCQAGISDIRGEPPFGGWVVG
ncbi:MAG: hypothetical protein SR1Q7_11005 [Quinella sp. 1Q7]|nr:hypothetical protein [Quinella sp. 1Q7]